MGHAANFSRKKQNSLYAFGDRFSAVMKTCFILVTNWYFDFYQSEELGNHACRRKRGSTRVGPGFLSLDGLLVCHTSIKASAMPMLDLGKNQGDIITGDSMNDSSVAESWLHSLQNKRTELCWWLVMSMF